MSCVLQCFDCTVTAPELPLYACDLKPLLNCTTDTVLQNRMLSALHRTYEASPDEKINTAIEVAFAAASALIIALLVATALMEDAPPGYDAIVRLLRRLREPRLPYNRDH